VDARRRRLFADEAARARYGPRLVPRIDRELWGLSGAEVVIDRALGQALSRLKEGVRYRRLGFELWRDYVRERVGVEGRWAQYLMALARGCEGWPEAWAALAAGRLTTWKALLLFQVVGKATGAEERAGWLERGERLTVRALAREVKGWKAKAPTSAPGAVSEDPREKERGQWVEIQLPERTVVVWRVAREVARRVSGEPLPAWRCLEVMVAERFAALGWEAWFTRAQAAEEAESARARAVMEKHARARAWLGLDGKDETDGTEGKEKEEDAGLGEAGWSGVERLEEAWRGRRAVGVPGPAAAGGGVGSSIRGGRWMRGSWMGWCRGSRSCGGRCGGCRGSCWGRWRSSGGGGCWGSRRGGTTAGSAWGCGRARCGGWCGWRRGSRRTRSWGSATRRGS
jgi:hypothetical protein